MLAEAEALAHSQKKKKNSETTEKFTRYAKFAALFWAIRAGVVALGFGVGGATGFMLWITSFFNRESGSLQTLPVWTFDDAVRKLPAPKILQRGLPLAMTGVPIAAGHKIYTLLAKYPFSPLQYNTESPVFTYESAESRGWTMECAAAYEESRRTNEVGARTTAHTASADSVAGTKHATRRVSADMLSSFPFSLKFKSKHKGASAGKGGDKDDVEFDPESRKILSTKPGAVVHSKGHWYASESIKGSLHSPLVQGLAPALVEFLEHAFMPVSQPAHVNLWAGSAGATCAPHYDTEDNFFLQLQGKKTFIITEPAAHDLFQPYSSLHPRWRQARNSQVLTPEDIREAYRVAVVALRNSTRQTVIPQANAIPGMKKNVKQPRQVMPMPQTWEITLDTGDMLFLPAYYFHAVISDGEGSVSINAWLPSQAAQIAQRISKEVELPFPESDLALGEPLLGWDGHKLPPADSSARLKLRLLARTVKEALHLVGTATASDTPSKKRGLAAFKRASQAVLIEQDFRRSLRARHGVLCRGPGEGEECAKESDSGVCASRDEEHCSGDMKGAESCGIGKLNLEAAEICTGVDVGFFPEAIAISERTVSDLAHLLKPIKDASVRKLLLMDYLDDVFALVAEDYAMNTPYGARAFVQSCF